MSNKFKKFLLLSALAALIIFAILGVNSLLTGDQPSQSGKLGEQFDFAVKNTDPFALDSDRLYNDDYRPGTTTDPGDDSKSNFTYLDAGTTATTSILVYSDRAVSVDALAFVVASSTSARLHICREYSYGGVDFFAEVNVTDTSNTETTFSAPRCYEFVPDHTATSTFALPASPITAPYTKINFIATGADAAVWIQTVAKEPTN